MIEAASMAPSAAPAPTSVCISSTNRMMSPRSRISFMTFFRRSSNSPRYLTARDESRQVERVELLVLRIVSGTSSRAIACGEALDDGGLADARLADQHRVVLGAAREDLHHALDLLLAADDRVELALARLAREVAAELVEQLVRLSAPLFGARLSGSLP